MRANGSGDGGKSYELRLGSRRTLTLPSALCKELGIEPGAILEVRVEQGKATIWPRLEARGILRGFFASWEDVNKFVEEERSGWEEREAALTEYLNRD